MTRRIGTALLYLAWRQLVGNLRRWGRRLKKPRYAIATIAGVAYFVLVFGASLFDRKNLIERVPATVAELLPWVLVLPLLLMATLMWLFRPAKLPLPLTEAELQGLLPAPISRRQLLGYGWLKAQPGLLFGACMLGFFGDFRLAPGFFLVLNLFTLHVLALSLFKIHAQQQEPARRVRLERLPLLVLTCLAVLLFLALRPPIEALVGQIFGGGMGNGFLDFQTLVREAATGFQASINGRAYYALTAVLRWSLAPVLAPFGATTWVDGVGFLALVGLHLLLIFRRPIAFEEAALREAPNVKVNLATRLQRKQAGKNRETEPFALPPVGGALLGQPEMAVVWKNFQLGSRSSLKSLTLKLLVTLPLITVVTVLLGAPAWWIGIIAGMGAFLIGFYPLGTGMTFRHDFRADLPKLEILRTWPLPAWRLVAAEIAVPVALAVGTALFGGAACLAVGAGVLLADPPAGTLAGKVAIHLADFGIVFYPTLLILGGLPLSLGLATLSAAAHNLATLVWPGLFPLGFRAPQQGSPALMGTYMLMFIGHFLCLALALLVPALIVALLAGLLHLLGAAVVPWGLPLFGLVGGLLLFAEGAALVVITARRWEQLDASEELLSS